LSLLVNSRNEKGSNEDSRIRISNIYTSTSSYNNSWSRIVKGDRITLYTCALMHSSIPSSLLCIAL
jgi:hypothetical protein